MDDTPHSDNDYPPPIPPLEIHVAELRELANLTKIGFYNPDGVEREAAHRTFDAIVERCVDLERIIEDLELESNELRRVVTAVTKDNERLQAVNDEVLRMLSLYKQLEDEEDDGQMTGEDLISDDMDASSPPIVPQDIQSEEAFLSGPDSAFSQSSKALEPKGEGKVVQAMTEKVEGVAGHDTEMCSNSENKDMQKLLKTIEPDKSRDVALMLRQKAHEAKEVLENTQQKMQILKKDGDRNGAKVLESRARELDDFWRTCSSLASKIYFNDLNPRYYHVRDDTINQSDICSAGPSHNLAKIDLHNMTVPEALLLAWEHVLFCRIRGVNETEIICGRGKHSKDGIPRLKPALLKALCRAVDINVKVHKRNPGCLVVQLLDGPPMTTNDDVDEIDEDMNVEGT